MNKYMKAALYGGLALLGSELVIATFGKKGQGDTVHDLWKYGGAMVGAALAAYFVG